MKIKLKFMSTVFMSVFLMGLVTGCDALKETDEKILAVVDAYKSADSETFLRKWKVILPQLSVWNVFWIL